MAIVPVRSLPLFAFANDGSIAWLRSAGSKVMAVDAKSGEVLREVQLDPAPFGITWSIERVGRFFVVKDDREMAAYDSEEGTRLWKRTSATGPPCSGAGAPRTSARRTCSSRVSIGADRILRRPMADEKLTGRAKLAIASP